MEQPRPFEIKVGDRQLYLELGKCAVALFRKTPEVDYLAIQDPEDEGAVIRIFNNQDFVRWTAGYMIEPSEDGLHRRTVYMAGDDDVYKTFREINGWNPMVMEQEEPSEEIIDLWLDVQMSSLDKERGEL